MSKLNTAERKRTPLSDFGDPKNRKYPIVDQSDVYDAASLIGKAENPEAVKARIIRIAKRKGFQLPKSWQSDSKDQDSGYGEFAGSLDDRISDVNKAFRAWNKDTMKCGLCSVEATFSDFILVHQYGVQQANGRYPSYSDYGYAYGAWDDTDLCWKVPYTYDEATDEVTFGDPQGVELSVVIKAIDGGDTGDQSQNVNPDQDDKNKESAPPAEENKPATPPVESSSRPPVELNQSDDTVELDQTYRIYLEQDGIKDTALGKIMHVKGVATSGDVVNKRTPPQVYPWEVWQDEFPKLQNLLQENRLIGEAEHPKDGKMSLDRTVLKFTKLIQDDAKKQIQFEADILPTEPYGKNLQILIANGVPVDISSRGRGKTLTQDWNGQQVEVVQRGTFSCKGFDAVIAGASPNSTITDWQMNQSENPQEDDEMDPELAKQIIAGQEKLTESIATLVGALTKPAETKPQVQDKGDENKTDEDKGLEQGKTEVDPKIKEQIERLESANKKSEELVARQEKAALLQDVSAKIAEVKAGDEYSAPFLKAYERQMRTRFEAGQITSAETLEQAHTDVLEMVKTFAGELPRPAGKGQSHVKKTKAEINYNLTPNEVIERLLQGVPDTMANGADPDMPAIFQSVDAETGEARESVLPDHVKTPKRQLRQIMKNIAKTSEGTFNGRNALHALVMLEQGRTQEAQDWMEQSFMESLEQTIPTGATAVGAGGAPTSNVYIFPLYRRAYPQLILPEIASVQPIDRPEGKIFFLDAYRVESGLDETDPAGDTVSDRARIDLGSANPPNPTYADDPGEFEPAALIQLRLASKSVSAETKKLAAIVSVEETQDLRAYHGLDAMQELMSACAKEMAMEWNYIALSEMLSGAGFNRTYGVNAPSGYTAFEWEAYLSRFINAVSTDIFKARNGEMTHIIAGADAWLALSATFRMAAVPTGTNPEMYAGLVFTPFADASVVNVRTYKTNLWKGVNRNKILIIRKGTDWSDTPYVWSPYASYTSPILNMADTFYMKQGIMDRVAHTVVASEAIGTVTLSNATGTPIAFPTAS